MALRKSDNTLRLCHLIRKYSTKPKVSLNETVLNNINNEEYKPRHHPGIMQPKTVTIPDTFVKAVTNMIEDYPLKSIIQDSDKMSRHLKNRVPPMEKNDMTRLKQRIEKKVLYKMKNFVINTEEDEMRFKSSAEAKMSNMLREKVYNWQPMKYDTYNSLVYLFARSAAEYSVLVKIFTELQNRDPQFKARSLFDFGSGVGTVTWAANMFWKKDIFEYFNVDSSRDMNDLAQTLLQGGRGTGHVPIKGVFYRQFLPAQHVSYDLVVSAYSLLELPSSNARLQTVLNLWNKTQKYLVIVEQGTNAGFKVVNEVRDFILQINKENSQGHVFSPCPHDDLCPRFALDDGTPCNFQASYFSLPVGTTSIHRSEKYSYVVLRKGKRNDDEEPWPRIVREVLVRSKHSICRLCTAKGDLKEIIFTKSKHGKTTYHCARASKWGDLLPVTIENTDNEEIKAEDFYCDASNDKKKTTVKIHDHILENRYNIYKQNTMKKIDPKPIMYC